MCNISESLPLLCFVITSVIIGLLVLFFVFVDCDLILLWYSKFGSKLSKMRSKVAWVTGAGSGIGECLAYELAKAGCTLVLSDISVQNLNKVKENCLALASSQINEDDLIILNHDVTDFDLNNCYVKEVIRKFGTIDMLFLNAGKALDTPVESVTPDEVKDLFELNVFSYIQLAQAVLPHMKENGSGNIMVTSSLAGKMTVQELSVYSATKHALIGFFSSMRAKSFHHNIGIQVACPGYVRTNIFAMNDLEPEVGQKELEDQGIKLMTPERCAYLMGIALSNNIPEVWISTHPILAKMYLHQYLPWIAEKLNFH